MKNFLKLAACILFFFTSSSYAASAPSIVILVGPPGSGKGTQGALLQAAIGLPHISTGDLFRENLKKDTSLGALARRCSHYMEQGLLIPDDLILQIIRERISQQDCQKGFILDGYPRTISQAETVYNELKGDFKVVVIHLSLPDEIAVGRISHRQICPECQSIFTSTSHSNQEGNRCDKCGVPLVVRADDDEAVVRKRLQSYNQWSKPLLEYFSRYGAVKTVNADAAPAQVSKELLEFFTPYNRSYLAEHLEHYPFKGMEKFYDVIAIYKDPDLMSYITNSFVEKAMSLQADYIAAPEARSLPIMGAVADRLHLPAIFIRKAGKIPGPTHSVSYSTGYASESIELRDDKAFRGKRVVIIDDGIGKGGTLLAAVELLEKAGMQVVGCLVVIEHHYCPRLAEFKSKEAITTTLFDL